MRFSARLFGIWEAIRTSYWFVPSLMVLGALLLSYATIQLDRAVPGDWARQGQWLYTGDAEGARALLTTIAGSMIGIAGVVFSITIVVLTLTASQFGPRLLRNFVRDLATQIVLGTFVATFLFCLMILRKVHEGPTAVADDGVPQFSLLMAVVLALASVGVLIFFIHHIATAIQAPNVVTAVSRELNTAIDQLFPAEIGYPPTAEQVRQADAERQVPTDFESSSTTVAADHAGHIQRFDEQPLMREAVAADLIARVECRPGQFVQPGDVVIRVWPADRVDEAVRKRLRACFTVHTQRSMSQDIEFAIDQIVEIAVRALSPSVNDPFTAMHCIDRLGVNLSVLASRRFPSRYRMDNHGRLRVIARGTRMVSLLDAAFNQIRHNSKGQLAVMLRMLEAFERIARHTIEPADREALTLHTRLVRDQAFAVAPTGHDRAAVARRYAGVCRALDAPPPH